MSDEPAGRLAWADMTETLLRARVAELEFALRAIADAVGRDPVPGFPFDIPGYVRLLLESGKGGVE